MSTFYTLYIHTSLSTAEIEEIIQQDHIPNTILNLGVHECSARSSAILASTFPFHPTINIVYHDVPGNAEQSRVAMITTVVKLLMADESDLVFLYQVDTTLLQRFQSALILNDTDFWRPEYRALVTLPYTVEKLPAL